MHLFSSLRKLVLLFLLFTISATANPRKLSLATSNPAGGGGLRFGYSRGMYVHHLSGPEIYMWRINNGYTPEDLNGAILEVRDEFTPLQQFNCYSISIEGEGSGIGYQIGLNYRRRTSDAKYVYQRTPTSASFEVTEKVKLTHNDFFLKVGHRFDRLYLGASINIGTMKALRKYSGDGIEDKSYNPWFFRPKILGTGYTARQPVAGIGLHVQYDISVFTIELYREFGMLNGQFDSATGKYSNLPYSTKVFPIANMGVSLLYHISK